MALPSIRRLALADLDANRLRELVQHGEDLLVERKRELPDDPITDAYSKGSASETSSSSRASERHAR